MRREAKKYLFDISESCRHISEFTSGKSFQDYEQDRMLRSAVERQFEIVGEALNHLNRIDPDTANEIPDFQRIIAFRNILIHGYAAIQDRTVWGVIEGDLPSLADNVERLLSLPQ